MSERFTVDGARELLSELRAQTDELVEVRAQLADAQLAQRTGESPAGGVPEVKALEARLHELVEGFTERGVQVKGIAPLLLDFPAEVEGREGLLCWVEREPDLAYWHPIETGFMGRRPIPE
jgi:hypothetical protein